MLNQADVVLADLTDMNPNVFYELGVRHTLKNRTILVSQSLDFIPSDLRQYGIIIYDTTPKGVVEYKKKINNLLKDIREDPDRSDNPVSDYLHLKSIVTESFEAKSIEKKLVALVSECSYNLRIIDETIENIKSLKMKWSSFYRFQTASLEILISTYYIYPDANYIEEVRHIFIIQGALNSDLDLLKDERFRSDHEKILSRNLPKIKEVLKNFMKQTSKILKDFRNQNYIEPSELSICVSDEEHKTYLD
jgi:hypothetical protein